MPALILLAPLAIATVSSAGTSPPAQVEFVPVKMLGEFYGLSIKPDR
jgi:hypothetical protein